MLNRNADNSLVSFKDVGLLAGVLRFFAGMADMVILLRPIIL